MLLIESFNICLRSAGLRRISDIDLDDEQTADIDEIIKQQKEQVQYDGWPFNMDVITLTPVGGEIDVSGFLRVELPLGLTVLDDKVYDPRKSAFHDEELKDIWVISDRTWDDIPIMFQELIARRSATRFVNSISGPDDTYQEARLREREATEMAHLSDDAIFDPQVLFERRLRQLPVTGSALDIGPGFGRRGF